MIIIAGATGFIGSNIAADLNRAGRTDLLLVDVLGTQGKWKNIAKRRFVDIVSPNDIDDVLPKLSSVDAVFHMGANSSTTATDGDDILRTNLRCSMNWWRWCTQTRTPLLYASSAATYGDGAQGFRDDDDLKTLDELRPLNLYGWSKHAFDKWAVERAAAGEAPPQWAGLKFFNVYGPNEYHKDDMRSLVAKNTAAIARGETIKLFKSHKDGYVDGGQLRDFVYVKECTKAMLWMLGKPGCTGLFNLGTGKARSFLDLMHAIGRAVGKDVNVEYVDMPLSIRPNYQYFTEAAMDKLAAQGYTMPSDGGLEQGVQDYVQSHLLAQDPFR